jgi:hypothetical protein
VTVRELIHAARREWLVLAVGLMLTAFASYAVVTQPGTYWSRSDVLIILPANSDTNVLAHTSDATIRFAGVIQRELSGGPSDVDTVSDDVRIVDLGIRDGALVRLPNDGNQYANNFTKALLNVQVAGPSEAEVAGRMSGLVERIKQIVAQTQDAAAVPESWRVRVQASPAQVQVVHEQGRPSRAFAVTWILGMAVTWAGVVLRSTQRTRLAGQGAGGRHPHLVSGSEGADSATAFSAPRASGSASQA